MLGNNYRNAVFTAEGQNSVKQSFCTDGIKLSRGLVQNERRRAHCNGCGKVHKLLLAAGKLRYFAVKYFFKRKERGSLGNAKRRPVSIQAEVFKSEQKLTADFIRHSLRFGVLHNKADFFRRFKGRKLFTALFEEFKRTGYSSDRCQRRFEQTQESCFSASALSAKKNKFAAFDLKVNIFQNVFSARRSEGNII